MARSPRKEYRVRTGFTHWAPNPDFKPRNVDDSSGGEEEGNPSHIPVPGGEVVLLTDAQYEAFKDKFTPVTEEANSVKDEEVKKLETAKAAAAIHGTTIDPNKPIAPQIGQAPAGESVTIDGNSAPRAAVKK